MWASCWTCGKRDASVRERGRIDLWGVLCDGCWNVRANRLAEEEGTTATPLPEPDPDDTEWIEAPVCEQCGAAIRVWPTEYDRWVALATRPLPAKDVPEHHRWRLVETPAGCVAVRLRGARLLPDEPVYPHHQMLCVPEEDAPRRAN